MAEYEAYKDSGATWIGQVPSAWRVCRLKNHLRRQEEKNPGNMQVLSLYRELGIVPKNSRSDNHNVTSEDTSNYKYVKPGDFVVNKMKAWQGSVAVSDYEGIVSPAYYVYKFLDDCFHKRYFHYLIRSCYKEEFMSLSAGIRIGQWDLSSEDLDNVPILIPTTEEQETIATYLDRETERIDAIISEAKANIEEYKAWKVSIVYEAVTKGLNPNTTMKDSGFEWIGSIPSHWRLVPNKRVMHKEKRICEKYTDQDIISLTMNGVIVRDLGGGGKMPTSFDGYQYVYPGELLMCLFDIDVTPRCVGRVYNEGLTSPAYSSFILHEGMNLDYYYYYYLMMDHTKELLHLSKNLRHSLTEEQLGQIKVPVPPMDEQIEIGRVLDRKTTQIDALIAEKEALIKELDAYKKSLIFEVVTGKRKVV